MVSNQDDRDWLIALIFISYLFFKFKVMICCLSAEVAKVAYRK